ncbi:hypothetical protein [Bacillus phage vB_BanS-Thrax3]|nr:hypothetical protein [Bacillus phage vB_BanS-Thrax3]
MPVHKGTYKCLQCEDIFEAVNDGYTKCKCGESEIEPNSFGYSYRNGNKVEVIDSETYYLEDDFIKLSDEAKAIYEEIKKIKKETGYKYYVFEMHEKGKDGEQYLYYISLEYNASVSRYTSETNSLKLTINLKKRDYFGEGDNIESRLKRFLGYMKAIESEELDFSKRADVFELAEKDGLDYREEPTGDVNYNFYV